MVIRHLAITYGDPGDWYYNESEADFPEVIFMAMFVATNQSFFIGTFFLISAFFVVPSVNRIGITFFIKDRLIRLGIPLITFFFLLGPLTVFIRYQFIENSQDSYLTFIINGWGRGFGILWFIEGILLFTSLFLVFRKPIERIKMKFPGTYAILLFAIGTGVV